jgi:hypothetical protein
MYNQMETWLVLYKAWKNARCYIQEIGNDLVKSNYSTHPDGYANGICITLDLLLTDGKISQRVNDAIIRKIDKKKLKLKRHPYLFTRDLEGKKARTAFRLRQYKEMKRKR